MTKPFVKVSGGKRRLVDEIMSVAPKTFRTYREPFVGGGALFFSVKSQYAFPAVLGDRNEKLVNVYKVVRDHCEELINALLDRSMIYSAEPQTRQRAYFEEIRANNFEAGSPIQRAADYIFINKTCFNGLYRENKSGQFNVPFGRYANPTICDEEGLRAASGCLQNAVVQAKDFATVLEKAVRGDFVYFDPPYAPLSATSNFTDFISEGFTKDDQIRLRDVAVELRKRGVAVVLSNSSAPLIRELYAGFKIKEIMAARAINSKGEGRGKIHELLIY